MYADLHAVLIRYQDFPDSDKVLYNGQTWSPTATKP